MPFFDAEVLLALEGEVIDLADGFSIKLQSGGWIGGLFVKCIEGLRGSLDDLVGGEVNGIYIVHVCVH